MDGVTQAQTVPGVQAVTRDVLIERWLPIAEIGVESQREHGFGTPFPAVFRVHTWWARRPLMVSRAAVLASVLPAWNQNWPDQLHRRFPTEETYNSWIRDLLGIQGDPVAGRKLSDFARTRGITLKGGPYDGPRAFTVSPREEDIELMLDLLELRWGTREISVLDPTAGGGSIPFEAMRYGFTTYANELNPVASVILAATLDYPARYGPSLADDIRKYGLLFAERVEERLEQFFPRQPGESIFAYLWARTVACPGTGKPVPLSPNWWLSKGSKPFAARMLCEPEWQECRFEIVQGDAVRQALPDQGTIKRGVGISPWTGEVIESDYIKREAQAGRMGQQLYAVVINSQKGKTFRSPTEADLKAANAAASETARSVARWQMLGYIPTEEFPEVSNDPRPRHYGMPAWHLLFSPRQLLALSTMVEVLGELESLIDDDLPSDRAQAVRTYLAFAIDKGADYNSRMVRFHSSRGVLVNTFDRHDFSFKWSHGEFDAAHNLVPWAVDQVAAAYRGVAVLAESTRLPLWQVETTAPLQRLNIFQGDAADLEGIAANSVHVVCVDPPYYHNVQYAELSDFFYVWQKRTIGDLYPEWFRAELTDKDDEAVANPARFAEFGPRRGELAKQDYERKMAAIFRESNRVLKPDGVLTVMFTHKQVEAWDTLAAALIAAGFRIEASWPAHTESEHSLHQAQKNAAASTILLVCRKREESSEPVWWEDIRASVRHVARESASQFAEQGITGVDLYISAFGPALSVISEHWPVLTSEVDTRTGQPMPIRPEVALDLAREEVINLRKEGLLAGRNVQFDPGTDWYLMAWDAFRAAEFRGDEARKLALALGLDLEDDIIRRERLAVKKASNVVLQTPKNRRRRDVVDPEATQFPSLIDVVHTAMLLYEEDGPKACEQFLKRNQLLTDDTFKACLQALINAIPRTRMKDRFARTEAETLDRLRQAFFEDLQVPVEESPAEVFQQASLLSASSANEDTEDDVDDEEDDE